jgi:hypothetical protein
MMQGGGVWEKKYIPNDQEMKEIHNPQIASQDLM